MTSLAARLRALFPEASGRSLKQWLVSGRVRVEGEVVKDGRAEVAPGARVALGPPSPRVAFPAALRLVHEDEHLLVVDKPPGLLSIATEGERRRTAYRLLWDYLAAQRPPRRPFIVHRLDRETSGLLVVAKTAEAKRKLQAQFEARSVERIYVAVVERRVREDQGTLRGWLVEDEGLRVRQASRRAGAESGKEASPATACWSGARTPRCWSCRSAPGGGRRSASSSLPSATPSSATRGTAPTAGAGSTCTPRALASSTPRRANGCRSRVPRPQPGAPGHDPGASAGRLAKRWFSGRLVAGGSALHGYEPGLSTGAVDAAGGRSWWPRPHDRQADGIVEEAVDLVGQNG